MWIKLTSYDGTPVRINMDNVVTYYPYADKDKDGEGKTFLEYKDNDPEGNVQGASVRETVDLIDAITKPVNPNPDKW